MKMLAEKLGLTDDQKAKIKPIVEDEMQQARAVREDESLDREARWQKFQEIRKAHNAQIRALLTPDQQKKLDEMREQHGPMRGGPGSQGGPGGPGGPGGQGAPGGPGGPGM